MANRLFGEQTVFANIKFKNQVGRGQSSITTRQKENATFAWMWEEWTWKHWNFQCGHGKLR
jgi:hypothetical protein